MCSILKQCWSVGYVSLLTFSFIYYMYRLPNTWQLENINRFVTSQISNFNHKYVETILNQYSRDPLLLVSSEKMYKHIWIHIK